MSEPTAKTGDEQPPGDVVVLGGPTEDGRGARVLRVRDQSVSIGEVRPLEEGKPIHGEVVALAPRAEQPRICDVRTLHTPHAQADATTPTRLESNSHAGPARIASSAYREGWDAIFAKRSSDPRMN